MMKLAENNDTCSSIVEKDPSKLPNDQIRLTTWNPVGELLEITQKHSMRPPVFEYGPVFKLFSRVFVCAWRVITIYILISVRIVCQKHFFLSI
jgi:hypothetical protein